MPEAKRQPILFHASVLAKDKLGWLAKRMRAKRSVAIETAIQGCPNSVVIDFLAQRVYAHARTALLGKLGSFFDHDLNEPRFVSAAIRRCRLTPKDIERASSTRNATVLASLADSAPILDDLRRMLAPLLTCDDVDVDGVIRRAFKWAFAMQRRALQRLPRLRDHCFLLAECRLLSPDEIRKAGIDAEGLQRLITDRHPYVTRTELGIDLGQRYFLAAVETRLRRQMTFSELFRLRAVARPDLGKPGRRSRRWRRDTRPPKWEVVGIVDHSRAFRR